MPRPIIFSAPMIRALLEGRKTQTRRVAKITDVMGNKVAINCPDERLIELEDGEFRRGVFHYESTGALSGPYRLPYAIGDLVYVKEAWSLSASSGYDKHPDFDIETGAGEFWYRATDIGQCEGPWASPMFMPRRASRLTLRITDVRVQRLDQISVADCFAEGIQRPPEVRLPVTPSAVEMLTKLGVYPECDPLEMYRRLWNSIHGPDAWDRNDWVAAYTFEPIKQNIDELKGGA